LCLPLPAARITPHYQMLVIHPAFNLSSYVLPWDPKKCSGPTNFWTELPLVSLSAISYPRTRHPQGFVTVTTHFWEQELFEQAQNIRGGADKSLAWPGRKQATMNKFGIYTYSTNSPWISKHFLAHCSNFFKLLKKKIQKVVCPTRSLRQKKNGDLSIVFSVQGTGGSRTGPDLENRVGDQDTGRPGRPVSSGLQVPG